MSTAKQTAKPSSHDGIDFDFETKPSTSFDSFSLLGMVDAIKSEYNIKSDFDFKLFCRRIDNSIGIPIQFIIKKEAKDVVIHYDKLQEILGTACTIRFSFSKIKKISAECLNVFIKGNSKIKKFVKAEWKGGKPISKENSYIDHVMISIDSNETVMKQIKDEIVKYCIPVPESESDIEIDNDDLNLED